MKLAHSLIEQISDKTEDQKAQEKFLKLIETILICKLPSASRQEIRTWVEYGFRQCKQ